MLDHLAWYYQGQYRLRLEPEILAEGINDRGLDHQYIDEMDISKDQSNRIMIIHLMGERWGIERHPVLGYYGLTSRCY
jgi:hypothetical protein